MDDLKKGLSQARDLWGKLSGGRRLIVVAALLATAGVVGVVTLRGDTTQWATLYGGMRSEDAGTVVDALKEAKVEYRLGTGGTSVEVPADKVAEVRLALAQKGLPRGGGVGFEIFDKQSFGATSFVEKMNYLRGLQGELGRSILTLDEVENARVHLALPERSLYKRSEEKASASVALRLRAGRQLTPGQVRGIAFLVAGSVEGLSPDQVTIVDEAGRMLSNADDEAGGVETQRELERSLTARVEKVVARLVGEGHAAVVVTVEMDRARTERTEELYDKDKFAVRSETRSQEAVGDASATASGVAGVRGNLPGAPAPASGVMPAGVTRLNETRNYEVNRVVQKTTDPIMKVKQLHVAILVDQNGDKPRSAEELARISALAREAAGLSKDRGDSIEVSSAPFAVPPVDPTAVPAPPVANPWPLPIPPLYAAAAGGALLLLIAVAAIIFVRRGKKKHAATRPAGALPALPVKVGELEAVVSGQLDGATMAAGPMLHAAGGSRERALTAARTDAARAARLLSSWLSEKSA